MSERPHHSVAERAARGPAACVVVRPIDYIPGMPIVARPELLARCQFSEARSEDPVDDQSLKNAWRLQCPAKSLEQRLKGTQPKNGRRVCTKRPMG